MTDCGLEERLIVQIAGMLRGRKHVAVGASSPIPGAAAFLAQAWAQTQDQAEPGGRMRVSVLGSVADNFFTDGGRELFDCAAQGRIDAFFLGGGQIDGRANINLVGVGSYPESKVRFPGSFGSAYLYYLVPRVILFRLGHDRRSLVEQVDFISAPGLSPDNHFRTGGPHALVTDRCVFRFDRDRQGFVLHFVHPGQSVEEIRDNTGFDFALAEKVESTPDPAPSDLALIRGRIAARVAETYPKFAKQVWDINAA